MYEDQTKDAPKRKLIKGFFKMFVDVKSWLSYDEVSSNTRSTLNLFRRLFRMDAKQNMRQETYEEAVVRLGLTEEQIISRKRTFLHSSMVYAVFALGFFVYFIYLIIHARILATCFSFILTALMAIFAYREHFWYMQMHKKKLGCNFRDWVGFILGK